MKRTSIAIALPFLLTLTPSAVTFAEPALKDRAIGLQLSVTVEPYDSVRNRFEVNVAPLVYQQGLSSDWQLKLMPLVNLRFDPGRSPVVSHIGLGVSLPFYLDQSDTTMQGWYLGPHFNYGYNLQDQNHNLTIAGDFGYSFAFENDVVLTVAAEAGMTWFDTLSDESGNEDTNTWRPHFGVKPQLMWRY